MWCGNGRWLRTCCRCHGGNRHGEGWNRHPAMPCRPPLRKKLIHRLQLIAQQLLNRARSRSSLAVRRRWRKTHRRSGHTRGSRLNSRSSRYCFFIKSSRKFFVDISGKRIKRRLCIQQLAERNLQTKFALQGLRNLRQEQRIKSHLEERRCAARREYVDT